MLGLEVTSHMVCRSTLRFGYVAVCYDEVQYVTLRSETLHCGVLHYEMLQHIISPDMLCYITLQYIEV